MQPFKVYFVLIVLIYIRYAAPDISRKLPKIVDGIKTQIERYPFMVGIFYFDLFICAGTIISKQFVLTAAHCVCKEFTVPASVKVRAGHTNTNDQNKNIHNVQDIRCHEDYSLDTEIHDIALVRIEKQFTFSSYVKKISLCKKGAVLPAGTMCKIVGWGYTKEEEENFHPVLREAMVPIVDRAICTAKYREENITIENDMLCAGYLEGGQDACLGDSGGPILHSCVQIGIISFGSKCGELGVYADVGTYADWIQNSIQEMSSTKTKTS